MDSPLKVLVNPEIFNFLSIIFLEKNDKLSKCQHALKCRDYKIFSYNKVRDVRYHWIAR